MGERVTMTQKGRDSQWYVLRRCLAIIRRVQRGPVDWRGLVEAVLREEPDAYGQKDELTRPDLLHDDLARIRNYLHIDIRADPRTKTYFINGLDRALLDLSPEDVATMAWLEQAFGPNSPRQEAVRQFLERLRFYLPDERRRELEQQRTELVMELGQQDDDLLSPEVELKLLEARTRRLQVEFDYLSSENETGQPRRHVVDVFEPPRFEPTLGHYYLHGWCHYNAGPDNVPFKIEAYKPYRMGRISNVHFTSNRLPASPPPARLYQVEYWLSAKVARQGVTRRRWIDIKDIEKQADESRIVRGVTDDVFFAVQELMHYRYHCQVRGGPEMAAQMHEAVQKMAELYEICE